MPIQSDPGPAKLLLAGSLALVLNLLHRDRRPTPVFQSGPPPTQPCPVPVERAGLGLVCLSPTQAASLSVQGGDRLLSETNPRDDAEIDASHRMSGLRSLLAGVPIDLRFANLADLTALPEIGEASARSIIAARQAGRLRCHAELQALPGLGRQRLRRLLAFVQPLPQDCPSVHPSQ